MISFDFTKQKIADDAKIILYLNIKCHVALCGIPVSCESLPSRIKLDAGLVLCRFDQFDKIEPRT